MTTVHIPAVFTLVCTDLFGLSADHTAQFWTALAKAHGPWAVALRQAVMLRQTLGRLGRSQITAERCVRALDDVVAEGLMSQAEASVIQEHVLRQVAASGQWKRGA